MLSSSVSRSALAADLMDVMSVRSRSHILAFGKTFDSQGRIHLSGSHFLLFESSELTHSLRTSASDRSFLTSLCLVVGLDTSMRSDRLSPPFGDALISHSPLPKTPSTP